MLQRVLEKQYKIKTQRIAAGKDLEGKDKLHKGKVLNCVIRRTEDGYELEADLRHAELVVEQLGLEDAKPVTTAGVDMKIECAAWAEG